MRYMCVHEGWFSVVALLYDLADHGGERYARLAELYARRFLRGEEYPDWAMQEPQVWGGEMIDEKVRRA